MIHKSDFSKRYYIEQGNKPHTVYEFLDDHHLAVVDERGKINPKKGKLSIENLSIVHGSIKLVFLDYLKNGLLCGKAENTAKKWSEENSNPVE